MAENKELETLKKNFAELANNWQFYDCICKYACY